jgi:hypothetical protein
VCDPTRDPTDSLCDLSRMPLQLSLVTLCVTPHLLRVTLCVTLRFSCVTLRVTLRVTLHVSCVTLRVSRVTLQFAF